MKVGAGCGNRTRGQVAQGWAPLILLYILVRPAERQRVSVASAAVAFATSLGLCVPACLYHDYTYEKEHTRQDTESAAADAIYKYISYIRYYIPIQHTQEWESNLSWSFIRHRLINLPGWSRCDRLPSRSSSSSSFLVQLYPKLYYWSTYIYSSIQFASPRAHQAAAQRIVIRDHAYSTHVTNQPAYILYIYNVTYSFACGSIAFSVSHPCNHQTKLLIVHDKVGIPSR